MTSIEHNASSHEVCPICLSSCDSSSFDRPAAAALIMKCGHRVHLDCISRKNAKKEVVLCIDDCPYCRSPIRDGPSVLPDLEEEDSGPVVLYQFTIRIAPHGSIRLTRQRGRRHSAPATPSSVRSSSSVGNLSPSFQRPQRPHSGSYSPRYKNAPPPGYEWRRKVTPNAPSA
eukprot:CAMPEP_0184646098 /NCGR_PEP_ID=MMETSP0308-20130426/2743_1 /TAXON_ID=38269 /ORGANISM="Gloeochaete witrockiana, Strain SAG 46.84" /LENGTH=171 /DNA_ID=CAMNT_0027075785 /DNA_START=109 /DNA_END=624 /DNA_ORIENTATION=-